MSEKTIAQKLLIKGGKKALFANEQKGYRTLLKDLPKNVVIMTEPKAEADVIQMFVSDKKELEQRLPKLKPSLNPKGALWVTYPKGISKVKTDINRDIIREYSQTIGLEALAIFSVDNDWSALRLKVV